MGVYSLPGYDAWKTAGPPEHVMVCPKCGTDAEQLEELEVKGLESQGLLAYPTYIPDTSERDDGTLRYRNGLKCIGGLVLEARKHSHNVTIYKCECGLILTDDAFVSYDEYHGDQEPDDLG